jgi:hypothetical protein
MLGKPGKYENDLPYFKPDKEGTEKFNSSR